MNANSSRTSTRQWLSVLAVTLSAFAFVTCEFIPVGLLPQIAQDIGTSTGTAGLMVSVVGGVSACAPAFLILAGRMDRRRVLLLLTVILVLSTWVSAISHDLATMLVARAILGAGLGCFWTLANASSGKLVNSADVPKATAAIFAGVSLAIIIGVPVGTFIADLYSWRAAFLAMGALAAIAFIMQWLLVPSLPSSSALRTRALADVLRSQFALVSIGMIALLHIAHFATYTYIAPLLQEDFSLRQITLLLFVFGVVGFLANSCFSVTIAKRLEATIFVVSICMLCAWTLLVLFAHAKGITVLALMLWGGAFGALPIACSLWMQRITTEHPEAGAALFVTTCELAVAGGSWAGGHIVDGSGIRRAFFFGGIVVLIGLVLLAQLTRWSLRITRYCRPKVGYKVDER